MLYKNLPEEDLKPVMRVRACLDYVAAVQFLLKGQGDNAKAVLKARGDYHRMKKEFAEARRINIQAATANDIPECSKQLLLWQFYAKGRKTFG